MPNELISRLQKHPVLCDGAMGTLLYAKGVFINRCYDELNVSQPDLIRSIHAEYLQAGAEIIETNTFGANSFRLGRHGCVDKLVDINRMGARIAREAVTHAKTSDALVAGAVGPLGVRIEPLGKIALSEARDAFREQIAALNEEGVDLIILETFGYLEELHQALLAAREVNPDLPVVAQVTIDEEGNCLDGSSPEHWGPQLEAWGADVIGCNCSVGPVAMLDTLERVKPLVSKPLAAQPNAGQPRSVEGRTIYLSSPEYMAEYAGKFNELGVKLIGGCCGTTPRHILEMKGRLKMRNVAVRQFVTAAAPKAHPVEPSPLGQRSELGRKIATGEFVTMVEIVPPKGTVAAKEIEGAKLLKAAGIDAVNIPDSPRASARMSNQALCLLVAQQVGIEPILHYTCRDRNVLGIQSDLLGASAIGIRNLICITGDPPKMGDYPDATAVFDVDSIGLVNIVSNLNRGLDIGGNPIGNATQFVIAVGANPGADNIDEEIRRFEYKVGAGAEAVVTQPVFDLKQLEDFIKNTAHCPIPVIAGIWPLSNLRNAEFMKNELRLSVPDSIMERMAKANTAEAARAEGIAIAREMLSGAKPMVKGVQISAPGGRYPAALDVLEALGGGGPTRCATV